MAMASNFAAFQKAPKVFCRKKERDRGQNHPYKVIEITPPPKNLGIRCFPPIRATMATRKEFLSIRPIKHRK